MERPDSIGASVVETPPNMPREQEKRRLPRGEKVFDALVYGPMNIIGTFLATMPLAWSLEHGLGGKPFDTVKNFLTSRLKINDNITRKALTTTTTWMGGNAMLLMVKAAENNKDNIVAGINRMSGDTTQGPPVLAEPRQDWGSLIKGRLLAWVVVFSSFLGFEQIVGAKAMGKMEEGFAHKLCDKFGWAKEEKVMIDGQLKTRPTRAFGYGKIMTFDIFATIAGGALLYVGSRAFAKRREEKRERREMRAGYAAPRTAADDIMAADGAAPSPATLIAEPIPREAAPSTQLTGDKTIEGKAQTVDQAQRDTPVAPHALRFAPAGDATTRASPPFQK